MHPEFDDDPDAPYEGDVIPVDVINRYESDADLDETALLGGGGIPDESAYAPALGSSAASAPETGDPRVDEVLRGLAPLDSGPTSEHVGVYDEVHRGLQDALANLDQG